MDRTHYLHGYTAAEQQRLIEQARILEPLVHEGVDFSACRRILELGCGVGAQTRILLRRFPRMTVHAIDSEPAQLKRAHRLLKKEITQGRVVFKLQDACRLSDPDASFDGIFACWLFEHVERPVDILREALRVLKPKGRLHGIEVMNSSLFLHPKSPAILEYWNELNQLQREMGGDPDIGAKIGNYLSQAGFADIEVTPAPQHLDQRNPKRLAEKIDYWEILLLSAAPQLKKRRRVSESLIKEMHKEFQEIRQNPLGAFFYTAFKFRAKKS